MKIKFRVAVVVLMIMMTPATSVNARLGCPYLKGGVTKTVAPHKTQKLFSGNLKECTNGYWVLIPSNGSNGGSDKAISIRCKDYGNSSTCQVTWSSGRKSWGSPYGPRSGGVVAGTDFLDAFGKLICVDLYASGGIKTFYC